MTDWAELAAQPTMPGESNGGRRWPQPTDYDLMEHLRISHGEDDPADTRYSIVESHQWHNDVHSDDAGLQHSHVQSRPAGDFVDLISHRGLRAHWPSLLWIEMTDADGEPSAARWANVSDENMDTIMAFAEAVLGTPDTTA